jgi:hypothetical protein
MFQLNNQIHITFVICLEVEKNLKCSGFLGKFANLEEMLGCNSVLIGHFEMHSIVHDLQKRGVK